MTSEAAARKSGDEATCSALKFGGAFWAPQPAQVWAESQPGHPALSSAFVPEAPWGQLAPGPLRGVQATPPIETVN
jgi:hypothetical protein